MHKLCIWTVLSFYLGGAQGGKSMGMVSALQQVLHAMQLQDFLSLELVDTMAFWRRHYSRCQEMWILDGFATSFITEKTSPASADSLPFTSIDTHFLCYTHIRAQVFCDYYTGKMISSLHALPYLKCPTCIYIRLYWNCLFMITLLGGKDCILLTYRCSVRSVKLN